jgi:hypothetical protein
MTDDRPHWISGPEFPRFLADLMAAEFSAMRPGAPPRDFFWRARRSTRTRSNGCGFPSPSPLRLADADENLRVLDAFPDWVRECRRVARGEAIGFRTSGSTGEPRTIAHDVAALAQEVEALRENLDIWMTDRLTAPQRPRAFSFGPSLPSDDRGKPCDWPASARPAPSAPP